MKNEIKPDTFFIGLPSLTALKAFVAATQYKSFTDAAKALCVTQSAISRQVRELEEQLNVTLFNRVGRSIELTESGRKLYETSYICFSHIFETVNEISSTRKKTKVSQRKTLTIAMTHAFSVMWMSKRVNEFREACPDIDLNIYSIDDSQSMANDTGVDGYISVDSICGTEQVSVPLFCDRIFPVCSPLYLENHPEITSLAQLQQADLLHLRGSTAHLGFGWRQWFEFTSVNLDRANLEYDHSLTSSSYQFLMQMTLDHHGVALGWEHLVDDLITKGELVRPVKEEVTLGNYVHYFTYRKNSNKEAELEMFKQWLLMNI